MLFFVFLLFAFWVFCFLCLLILLLIACLQKSWKIALWSLGGTLVGIVASTALIFLLIAVLYRPYDPSTEQELQQAYLADFGSLPPPGVVVLKSRQVVVWDSGGQWLLLKVSPEEMEKHVSMGFIKMNHTPPVFSGGIGGNTPEWWQPPNERLEFYENRDWSKKGGWSFSDATLGVDRSAGLIWFHASKID